MTNSVCSRASLFATCCAVLLATALPHQIVFSAGQEAVASLDDLAPGDWSELASGAPGAGDGASGTELAGAKAAWIVDDFEDGNTDGWVDEGAGACVAQLSSVSAFGFYSMRVAGECGHFLGRVFDVTGSKPTGVSVQVRADFVNTFDTYFILGDSASGTPGNQGAVYFHGSGTGRWSVFDGTQSYSCGTRNPDQWYRVDFNIDWSCKMYDVSIDGVRKQSNVPFYHTATESFDRIHVYNWSDAVARYDQISFSTPGVSPLVFDDGFERGSTCRWSATVP